MKTETFNMVSIGNRFYHHKELFVKMNAKQAIGDSGKLTDFNASQYVTVQIEKDREMCA